MSSPASPVDYLWPEYPDVDPAGRTAHDSEAIVRLSTPEAVDWFATAWREHAGGSGEKDIRDIGIGDHGFFGPNDVDAAADLANGAMVSGVQLVVFNRYK